MNDAHLIAELLGMLFLDWRIALLCGFLIAAAVIDIRTYRIPNWLTFSGIAVALGYSLSFPSPGGYGIGSASLGMLIAFVLILPFYMLRVMGAGDVKLMAMVGAFVGSSTALAVVVSSFIVGGIAAILFALSRRATLRMLRNIKDATQLNMMAVAAGMKPDMTVATGQSIGKLPFGASIGIGTIGYLVVRQLGFL